MTTLGWGSAPWGAAPWGGASLGVIAFSSAIAIRENVLRLAFTEPVYLTKILDTEDASRIERYAVTPVAGTVGNDGSATRPVRVVLADYAPVEEVGVALGRNYVDLTLDRPMTPFPALYAVSFTDVFAADLASSVSSTPGGEVFPAVFKVLSRPTIDAARPSRDIANPQVASAASSLPDPDDALNLGSIRVDSTGDYASDDAVTNLKKRVLRRLVTRKGAFAHLPNYGVGVPSYGKKLGSPTVLTALATEAEAQIALEPDVARVRVAPIVSLTTPGLVRFQVFVQPKTGQPQRLDVPFLSS